jgi:dihydroflavonol-4-reductase
LNQKKILITGASGSLGKQLIYHLTGLGIKPIAHCRESSDTAYIDAHKLEKRFADLRDNKALEILVEGMDAVIHTAAMVNFRKDQATLFEAINTLATAGLFRAARTAGVRRFVHVSSVVGVGARLRRSDNNGDIVSRVVNEDYHYNLGDLNIPYIRSKREAEDKLRDLAAEAGPELLIVNPSIIVSPSRSGNDRAKAMKMLSRWIIPDYPNLINMVDLRDVAPGIVAALEKGRPGERYILAGSNLSVRDLLLHVSSNLSRVPHLVSFPRPLVSLFARLAVAWGKISGKSRIPFYPELVRMTDYDWAYSSRKARRELGYRTRSIYTTLDDLLDNHFTETWLRPSKLRDSHSLETK